MMEGRRIVWNHCYTCAKHEKKKKRGPRTHLSEEENVWLPFKEQNLIKRITVSCFWAKLLDCFSNIGFPVFLSVQNKSNSFKAISEHLVGEDVFWFFLLGREYTEDYRAWFLNVLSVCFCFLDAQNKELLESRNITHILSIHDTAAPVLEVRSMASGTITSKPCNTTSGPLNYWHTTS